MLICHSKCEWYIRHQESIGSESVKLLRMSPCKRLVLMYVMNMTRYLNCCRQLVPFLLLVSPLVALLFVFLPVQSLPFRSTHFQPEVWYPVPGSVTVCTLWVTRFILVCLPIVLHSMICHCDRFLVRFDAAFIFDSAFDFGKCIHLR